MAEFGLSDLLVNTLMLSTEEAELEVKLVKNNNLGKQSISFYIKNPTF